MTVVEITIDHTGTNDRKVNFLTSYTLRGAFATSAVTFDFNNDGVVNAVDFAQFRARFGVSI